MWWRRILRVLLEPAKDPLRDSFGISASRVRELRIRLGEQLAELRLRAAVMKDAGLEQQIGVLQTEHDRLLQAESRVTGELNAQRAQANLMSARETAAQAQESIEDLLIALDDAQARASALAEASREHGR